MLPTIGLLFVGEQVVAALGEPALGGGGFIGRADVSTLEAVTAVVDVGLLGCMTGLHQHTLLDGNDLFIEFKGALTEQYVCQQLKPIENLNIYYYTNDRGSCEMDFVIDTGEQIIPVEVKAEVNLKAKSLRTYKDKFDPEVSIRTSMADYKKEDWLLNLPLYAVEEI